MSVGVRRVLGPSNRRSDLGGHVGFDSLPDQLVNKAVNKGFDFNILCIGDTGIGKSTLMDCLFRANFEDKPSSHKLPSVSLQANTYTLRESNVNLRLTVIDTLGFGDQIGRSDSFRPIIEYIDEQFEAYLQEELKIQRDLVNFHDTRVHACIYFLPPTGHSLKSLDLVCMKELMSKVNIIPIIAKSDTIAKTELTRFKGRIMQEIKENDVQIYTFPTDDQTVSELNKKMNDLLPFAVVGSREEVEVNGQKIRARLYPWGTVEIENETHCDFVKLREMLVRTNMEDLREKTHLRHYERYRQKKLAEMGFAQTDETDQPVRLSDLIEQRRTEHLRQMQAREDEMRQMFVNKVKDKEGELKAAEQELHAKFESLKKTHAEEKRKLEERRRNLDEEISTFNKHKAEVQATQAQAARELAQHSVGSPGDASSRRRGK